MKKLLGSLLVLTFVLAAAPVALADHCRICRLRGDGTYTCWIAVNGGKPICDDFSIPGTCVLSGTTCTGPHPFIEEPLAADFTVASVERLDEPQSARSSGTRIASLETTQAVHRASTR
jgi:hypothetical protein